MFALAFTALVSGYTIDGDTVIYENAYGKLTQTPHTLNDFNGDVFVNATSYFPSTQNLDFAFGFVTSEAKPNKAWKWSEDVAHEVPAWCDTSHSKQCDTDNFEYTTNPKYAWCYDDNETVKWEHAFDNGWVDNKTIEWFQWERSCTTTEYYDDWTKLNNFNTVDYGGKKWYVVTASFDTDETKSLKVNLDVQPLTSGKYDLFIKRSSDTWNEAFTNGNYVLLDPWYNNTWIRRKGINVTDSWNLDRQNEPVNLNVTGLSNTYNCTDTRVTWVDGTATENNHEFMVLDNGARGGAGGTDYCLIQLSANLTAVANATHAEANTTNYYFYYYNTSSVARGDTPDLKSWVNQYNAWVVPDADGFTTKHASGNVQNFTYDLNDNNILLVNDTVVGDYIEWTAGASTLATTRTVEYRTRFLTNTTANGANSYWFIDAVFTRRGSNVLYELVQLGHPDQTEIQSSAETTTNWTTHRVVYDNQGGVYSYFIDGYNSTYGSNLTQTLNGAGEFIFGTDYAGGGVSKFEIDYFTYTLNGYFPPLNYSLEAEEEAGFLNITVYDEQTNNRIYFNMDMYNTTDLIEYTDVFEVSNLPTAFPQGEVRLDVTNNSYYGRSRLININNVTVEDVYVYLINSSAVDVIATAFHIRTALGIAIDNATIKLERNIAGSIVTISELVSDFNGDGLFYLEVGAPYFITVTHPVYSSFFGQVNPSTTDYTITLSAAGTNGTIPVTPFTPSVLDDVYWWLSPYGNIVNHTANYTFFVNATNNNLSYFGMNISNATTTLYFENWTNSTSGGYLYYFYNDSLNTSPELRIQVWFGHSPLFRWERTDLIQNRDIFGAITGTIGGVTTTITNSGMGKLAQALLVLFIAIFIGAFMARLNLWASFLSVSIWLGFCATSGILDISSSFVYDDGSSYVVQLGVTMLAATFLTVASLLYLDKRIA